jgi:DNA topoisomerase-1
MPHNVLVIVESPAKCKKIESYLGPGFKVIASFGHLRTISKLEDVDIVNNFKTKYSIIQEELKLKQVEKIRSEITNASDVILATDDDREGEAIAWHICDLFGLPIDKSKRIIFHEITESAIQSAIAHPKKLDMNLVYAQQSRQILDLLVGFNISPILWNCVSRNHQSSLSAGRCQTPALRLVYDNYLDIQKSPGKGIYNTSGYFTNLNLLFELNKQWSNKVEVTQFLNLCTNFNFIFSLTEPKKVIKKAPEPLTTSSLQQLASNELHFSPKDTMKYAQQLYENGFITYMRTDSKKYSREFVEKTKKYIQSTYEDKFVSPSIDNLCINDNDNNNNTNPKEFKATTAAAEKRGIPAPQEAHEAIRPVNISCLVATDLEAKSIKLYELIWRRTIESCMSSAQFNTISAKITAPLDTTFVFKTEQPIFLGWQIVEQSKKKPQPKGNNHYDYLTKLKQNAQMLPKKIDSKYSLIELKSHFSEARLVQLLEEKGIGRPSTFASLIDKIQERKYVLKQNITGKEIECVDFLLADGVVSETVTKREFGNENNKLVIQPLGIIVIEFLLSKFTTFFNYDYTGEMENELDNIAKGDAIWTELCKKCNDDLTSTINGLQDVKKFSLEIDDNHVLVIGKYGPVVKYTCPKDSKKVSFIPVKKDLDLDKLKHLPELRLEDVIEQTATTVKDAIGKYKGKDLFVKKGKYGLYAQWGSETRSLKGSETNDDKNVNYIDVIRFLDQDVLDSEKPVGLVRELTPQLSIRAGKYGDYILYKKPRAKKPEFLKLNGFTSDYKKCDKDLLINWIKQTNNL